MYFELYVDVLFLVNFFMDYMLLLLIRQILCRDTKYVRAAAGAAAGAALTCILVILPVENTFLEFILFHLGVNTCMLQVGLKIKNISDFIKALILLYIGAFFMGGIMEAIWQYVKIGGLLLLFGILGYYLSLGMWKFLTKLHSWNRYHVTAELFCGNQKLEVKGLVDTGNGLREPVSGKPVSVLSRNKAKELLKEQELEASRISFQTVNKSEDFMHVFQIDKMHIKGERSLWIEKPYVGIAKEDIGKSGEYDLILSPNLF